MAGENLVGAGLPAKAPEKTNAMFKDAFAGKPGSYRYLRRPGGCANMPTTQTRTRLASRNVGKRHHFHSTGA
jgi:hypothetical protein